MEISGQNTSLGYCCLGLVCRFPPRRRRLPGALASLFGGELRRPGLAPLLPALAPGGSLGGQRFGFRCRWLQVSRFLPDPEGHLRKVKLGFLGHLVLQYRTGRPVGALREVSTAMP